MSIHMSPRSDFRLVPGSIVIGDGSSTREWLTDAINTGARRIRGLPQKDPPTLEPIEQAHARAVRHLVEDARRRRDQAAEALAAAEKDVAEWERFAAEIE